MSDHLQRMVLVSWVDTKTYGGWQEVPDLGNSSAYREYVGHQFNVEPVETYGFCLYIDSDKIVVAGSTVRDGDIGEVTVIPMGCVSSIEVLVPEDKEEEEEKEVFTTGDTGSTGKEEDENGDTNDANVNDHE